MYKLFSQTTYPRRVITALVISLSSVLLLHCGYRYYVGDLSPVPEQMQQDETVVRDNGAVVFVRDRLEISLRPMTDAELDRQFAGYANREGDSANPYTFGLWKDPRTGETPQRFTVFYIEVKNYTYPKVLVDPAKIRVVGANGRQYRPMTLLDLDDYFLPYVTGYGGNRYLIYEERMDILRRTLYKNDVVFSGEEENGYIVLPVLHQDVARVDVRLEDVMLRFDFRDEPVESIDVEYAFEREIGRVYPNEESQ